MTTHPTFLRNAGMSLLVSFLLSGAICRADVHLPAIFGSHMVLQQDMKIPIWGWADAGVDGPKPNPGTPAVSTK